VRRSFLSDSETRHWESIEETHYIIEEPFTTLVGALGLIFCDLRSGEIYDPSLPISKSNYLSLEKAFHLHPSTLPSFFNLNGICAVYPPATAIDGVNSRNVCKSRNLSAQLLLMKLSAIVIKASQMVHVGTWGISVYHDFNSRITTAFVLAEQIPYMKWSRYVVGPLIEEIREAIKKTTTNELSTYLHPMFLPTIPLSVHVHRATDYVTWHGNFRACELESEMGITRAGSLARDQPRNIIGDKTIQEAQEALWRILVDLNSRLTETLFMIRVCRNGNQTASRFP
jgi:hypothetical protein